MTYHVYSCFDADRRPIYVGYTSNLKRRLAEHQRQSPWMSRVAIVAVVAFDNQHDAESEERRRIAKYRPTANLQWNPMYRSVAVALSHEQMFEELDAAMDAAITKHDLQVSA